jgi:hypothetical protein
MRIKSGSASVDEESRIAIFEGVNATQLSVIFRADTRTVARKLFEGNVKPIAKRGNTEIYSIFDAAPYLCKPAYDVETAIKKMDYKDLPKSLAKEFWAGQRSKQDFEERAGLLWRTEKVVEEVGELMKLVKMSTLLMNDAVERQSELSDAQRRIIKQLSHGLLEDLSKRIAEKFQVPQVADYEPQEASSEEDL